MLIIKKIMLGLVLVSLVIGLTGCASLSTAQKWVVDMGELPKIKWAPDELNQQIVSQLHNNSSTEDMSEYLWKTMNKAVKNLEEKDNPTDLETLVFAVLEKRYSPELAYAPARALYEYSPEVYGDIFKEIALFRATINKSGNHKYDDNNFEEILIEDAVYYVAQLILPDSKGNFREHIKGILSEHPFGTLRAYDTVTASLEPEEESALWEKIITEFKETSYYTPWYSYYCLKQQGMQEKADLFLEETRGLENNLVDLRYFTSFDQPQDIWSVISKKEGRSSQEEGQFIVENTGESPYWGIQNRMGGKTNWLELSVKIKGTALLGANGFLIELQDTGKYRVLMDSRPADETLLPVSRWEQIEGFDPEEFITVGIFADEDESFFKIGEKNILRLNGAPQEIYLLKLIAGNQSSISLDWMKIFKTHNSQYSFHIPAEWRKEKFETELSDYTPGDTLPFLADGLYRGAHLNDTIDLVLQEKGEEFWKEMQIIAAENGLIGFFNDYDRLKKERPDLTGLTDYEITEIMKASLNSHCRAFLENPQAENAPKEFIATVKNIKNSLGIDERWNSIIESPLWSFDVSHNDRSAIVEVLKKNPYLKPGKGLYARPNFLYDLFCVRLEALKESYNYHSARGEEDKLNLMAEQIYPPDMQNEEYPFPFTSVHHPLFMDFFPESSENWYRKEGAETAAMALGGYLLAFEKDAPGDSQMNAIYREIEIDQDIKEHIVNIQVRNESNPTVPGNKEFTVFYGGSKQVIITIRNNREYKISFRDLKKGTTVPATDWESFTPYGDEKNVNIRFICGIRKVLVQINDGEFQEFQAINLHKPNRISFGVNRGSAFVVQSMTVGETNTSVDPVIQDLRQRAFNRQLEGLTEHDFSGVTAYHILRETLRTDEELFFNQLEQLDAAISGFTDDEQKRKASEYYPAWFLVPQNGWDVLKAMQDEQGYPSNSGMAEAVKMLLEAETAAYGAKVHENLLVTLDSLYMAYRDYSQRWLDIFRNDEILKFQSTDDWRWTLYSDLLVKENRAWSDDSSFMINLLDLEDYFKSQGGVIVDF